MRNARRRNLIGFLAALTLLSALPAPASAAAPPSREQVMLSMAYAADLGSQLTGESAAVSQGMAPLLACFLQSADLIKNQWTVVWGPQVITKKTGGSACNIKDTSDKVPTNTMFVAKKNGENTYVIAIAGTNRSSGYAWCEEDFNIVPLTWPYAHPGPQSKIAVTSGTYNGLVELQSMSDPQKGTLGNFLKGIAAGSTLYVTGHSLGGALAPALAQWLADTRGTWDPTAQATVQIVAFAGATPGFADFAHYMDSSFPGEVSASLSTSPFAMVVVNNTLDVVPHAWSALSQVSNLYQAQSIAPGKQESDALKLFQANVALWESSGWRYAAPGTALQQKSITGKLLSSADLNNFEKQYTECLPLAAVLQSPIKVDDFAKEALYQHVCAYPNQLALPNLWNDFYICQDTDTLKAARARAARRSR